MQDEITMNPDTTMTFIVNAYAFIIFIFVLVGGLMAVVWRGKKEIFDSIENALKPFKQSIESSIVDLGERISTHDKDIGRLEGKYGKPGSPMNPSPEGERLLEESGFKKMYPVNKNRIFDIMDKKGTRTLYDAEENARLALEELKSDTIIDPIKDYAVNHPKEPLDLIFTVASWVIRDDYWKNKKSV